MKKDVRRRIGAAVSTLAALATMVGLAPAAAAEGEPPGRVETPMVVAGFDAEVAAENGFKIVAYEDGSWESVAVTPEAQALDVETGVIGGDGVAAQRGVVSGPCGSAWVDANSTGRQVAVVTGYSVTAPVANRLSWGVTLWTPNGVPTLTWPTGPSGATWQGAGGFLFGTNTGGSAVAGGSVLLINGTICGSGFPADDF